VAVPRHSRPTELRRSIAALNDSGVTLALAIALIPASLAAIASYLPLHVVRGATAVLAVAACCAALASIATALLRGRHIGGDHAADGASRCPARGGVSLNREGTAQAVS